jgi:LPS-assembly lipoprotein
MWSSKIPSPLVTRRLWVAFACLLPLITGSCGFKPLYGKNSYPAEVVDNLASIEVDPIKDRQGQLIHNALLTDLNPRGEPAKARYHLQTLVTYNESQQALRTDDTATRNMVTYGISYYLVENNTRISTGAFTQIFSYDYLSQHYANIAAADDVHRRAAQSIADEIRNRLAAYFAKSAEMKAQNGNK